MIIYIHHGLTKTGSSAIQFFLSKNSEILLKYGYRYNESASSLVLSQHVSGSGNMDQLFGDILSNQGDSSRIRKIVKSYFLKVIEDAKKYGCEKVILSSESLCTLSQNDADIFLNSLPRKLAQFNHILYERDPYDWTFSSWLQAVKREGCSLWIDKAIEWDPKNVLKPILYANCLKKHQIYDRIIIHHYEKVKTSLIQSFLESIDFKYEIKVDDVQRVNFNRSLTKLSFLLNYFGNRANQSNRALLDRMKVIKDDSRNENFYFKDESLRLSIEHFLQDPDKADRFLCEYSEQDFIESLTKEELYIKEYIETTISYYKDCFGNSIDSIVAKINLYEKSTYKNSVPKDFDIFVYLSANSDIFNSDVDPYFHFSQYGCKEGRAYNLQSLNFVRGIAPP